MMIRSKFPTELNSKIIDKTAILVILTGNKASKLSQVPFCWLDESLVKFPDMIKTTRLLVLALKPSSVGYVGGITLTENSHVLMPELIYERLIIIFLLLWTFKKHICIEHFCITILSNILARHCWTVCIENWRPF